MHSQNNSPATIISTFSREPKFASTCDHFNFLGRPINVVHNQYMKGSRQYHLFH